MTINDLLSATSADTTITVKNLRGCELVRGATVETLPPFMLDYTVEDIDIRDSDLIIRTQEETLVPALVYIQQLANSLGESLDDASSEETARADVADQLRELSHAARRISCNLRHGYVWNDQLF